MTPTKTSHWLEPAWQDLERVSPRPAHRRIDDSHPLDWYIGVDADGSRSLILIVPSAPLGQQHYRAFEVLTHERADGRSAITLRLSKPEFQRVFSVLCEDLIEGSREGIAVDAAPHFLAGRLVKWEHLLARDRSGLLSAVQVRGLLGELLFVLECAIPIRGAGSTLHAWTGPLDAAQDFRFDDRFVEVKTNMPGQPLVRVASTAQLDVTGLPLLLWVASLNTVTAGASGAFNLNQLVERIRGSVTDPQHLSALDDKLALAGYRPRSEYDQMWHVHVDSSTYAIEPSFPKLTRASVPIGIIDCEYSIDLSQCGAFKRAGCF